jgi:Cu/Ag efflux protein CusF
MNKFGPIVTLAFALGIALPTVLHAQEGMKGEITKVDEAKGTISIKQSPAGTVGSGGAADGSVDFKVKDGLLFNAVQAGDKVVFTAATEDGRLVISKLQKQ